MRLGNHARPTCETTVSNILPKSVVNGYLIPDLDINGIGDWEGEERQAGVQFNRLLELLAAALPEPSEDRVNAPYEFERLSHAAWDSWGSDAALLTATDEQFRTWIAHHVA
jgi:hypothetical protein